MSNNNFGHYEPLLVCGMFLVRVQCLTASLRAMELDLCIDLKAVWIRSSVLLEDLLVELVLVLFLFLF
jgi:hypothetical protein